MSAFTEDTLSFLDELKANNNREWFQANRKTYDRVMKGPAAEAGSAMNALVEELTGRPHTVKIFRINRDIRFSKDKTPYNTHIHIAFSPISDESLKPMWFFGLDTQKLVLGAGVFEFPKDRMELWRERVAGDEGEDLAKILSKVKKAGDRISEPALKRVPKPYPADHPREELLRRKGLSVWRDMPDRAFALGEKAAARCANEFRNFLPVVNWLDR